MFADLINLKKIRIALLYVIYLILVLFLQDTIFARVSFLGVKMLFMPAAVVAVGMYEGGFRGGLFGLLAGYLCDMTFAENTVLFTVLFPCLGFAAGVAAEFWISHTFTAYLTTAAAGLLVTGLCQMVRVLLADPGAILSALLIVLLQTLWSLPMAAAVYMPVKHIHRRWQKI